MTTPSSTISIANVASEFLYDPNKSGYSLGDYYRYGKFVNYITHPDIPLAGRSISLGQLRNRVRRLEMPWTGTSVYIAPGSAQASYELGSLNANYGNIRKTIIVLHYGANGDGDAPLANWGTITATVDGSAATVYRDTYAFTTASDETAYNAWFRIPVGRANSVTITKTATGGGNDSANSPGAIIWLILDHVQLNSTNSSYNGSIAYFNGDRGYSFVAATGNWGTPGNFDYGLDNDYDLGNWTRTGNFRSTNFAAQTINSAGAFAMSAVSYTPSGDVIGQ